MTFVQTSPASLFIGESVLNGTNSCVLFVDMNSSKLSQDATNFLYDNVNAILKVPALAGGALTSSNLALQAYTPAFDQANTGRISFYERTDFNNLGVTVGSGFSDQLIGSNAVSTVSGSTFQYYFLNDTRTVDYSVSQLFSACPTMVANSVFTPTVNALADSGSMFAGFIASPNYKVNVGGGNSASTSNLVGYLATPKAGPRTTGSGTVTSMAAFQSWGYNLFTNDIYANNTVTNLYHALFGAIANVGTVTNQTFVSIPASTVGTNIYGVASALAQATGRWFLYGSGTADSAITGQLRLGDTTAPTALLDLIGKLTATTAGLITRYNNIATVSNGVPSELVTVDNLTSQAAAITATTLYAVPASGAGMYRISWTATVTRAATTSSILGGAGGFQILYTDNDDSVVKTTPGTVVTGVDTNATNSTSTGTISGCVVVNAKASTNIQYQIGYTSVGVTTMQYNLHMKVEAL